MEGRRLNRVVTNQGRALPGAQLFPDMDVGEGSRAEQSGFAGTYCTTLLDWIQMVQLGRRDAVLTIRAGDGRQAILWFQSGDIIDASCEGLTGKDAVYRIVAWQNGEVSLAFLPVDQDRRIEASTSGLLLEALARKDEAEREGEDRAVGASLPAAPVQTRRSLGGVLEAIYRVLPAPQVASAVVAALLLLLVGVLVARRAAPPAHASRPVSQPPSAAISVIPLPAQPSLATPRGETSLGRPSMTTADAPSLAARAPVGGASSKVGAPPVRRRGSMKEARPVAPLLEATAPPKREGVNASDGEGRRASTREVGTAVKRQPNIRLLDEPHPGIRLISQPEARIDVVD